jgi:hypothetical protein
MSEAIQIALIGFAGAVLGALLTAFVQPLWTALLGKQSKLQIKIAHHHFQIPTFFQEAISEYIYNYKLNVRPTQQARDNLRALNQKSGLSLLTITNRSKRSIEDIAIHLEGSGEFVCDLTLDGETRGSAIGRSFTIGNLRAGAECNLAIWTPSDLTGRWSSWDSAIQISAKEYDKISIAFPVPGHVTAQKFLLPRKLFWVAFWVLIVAMNIITFGPIIIRRP